MSAANLTGRGLQRIASATVARERGIVNRPPPRPRPPVHLPAGWSWAIVGTGGINAATAGTPPTPARGPITLYDWDPVAQSWSAGTVTDALNMAVGSGANIPASTLVGVAFGMGEWWVMWVLCA